AVEVDELDRVAVRIVEIGVAAGEAAVALLLVQQHLDTAGLDMGERGIKVRRRQQKGMVDERVAAAVLRRVVAGAREHKILLAAAHEHGGVVAPPEGGADHILVEAARAIEIADAQREMQDPGRRRAARRGMAHALGVLERRALEPVHSRTSRLFSLPPCGGGSGWGVVQWGTTVPHRTTPAPNPSPQGGGE